MPRHPDPYLEERILQAARKLWKKGAEKALTMRAVARAAGTNTPAVYRRFRNREDILQGILRSMQVEIADWLRQSSSPEEFCERYLQFALSRPHEYELFYTHLHQLTPPARTHGRTHLREHRPAMAMMEEHLSKRLGGPPDNYTRLSMALWTVAHGTAMILISKAIPAEHVDELHSVFTTTIRQMIRDAEK